jgi:hypothetical protein
MPEKTCGKCGGGLEEGFTTALGLDGGSGVEGTRTRLVFVVPGGPTSMNPIRAFRQGMAHEPGGRHYGIVGSRCARCGSLELYTDEEERAV